MWLDLQGRKIPFRPHEESFGKVTSFPQAVMRETKCPYPSCLPLPLPYPFLSVCLHLISPLWLNDLHRALYQWGLCSRTLSLCANEPPLQLIRITVKPARSPRFLCHFPLFGQIQFHPSTGVELIQLMFSTGWWMAFYLLGTRVQRGLQGGMTTASPQSDLK